MSFSPALKWLLALLLPLTFAWKLTGEVDDTGEIRSKIAAFLLDHRFAVAEAKPELGGMLVVRATAGACRMLVIRASADGWDRDMIRDNFGNAADRVFIVFRGKVRTDQPNNWLIVAGRLQSRILHRLGLAPHVSAALVVVASSPCDAERLPWDHLRDL